jgi:hypothetical protein
MARKYFTLLQLIDGVWSIQFGDFDRECVDAERRDMLTGTGMCPPKARELKIITSGSRQHEIVAKVAELNAKAAA